VISYPEPAICILGACHCLSRCLPASSYSRTSAPKQTRACYNLGGVSAHLLYYYMCTCIHLPARSTHRNNCFQRNNNNHSPVRYKIHPPHTLYSETRSSTQHVRTNFQDTWHTACETLPIITHFSSPSFAHAYRQIPDVSQRGETPTSTTSTAWKNA
jgi:hypothetical protein